MLWPRAGHFTCPTWLNFYKMTGFSQMISRAPFSSNRESKYRLWGGASLYSHGSPHYPESKMQLRCTASGCTPLGQACFTWPIGECQLEPPWVQSGDKEHQGLPCGLSTQKYCTLSWLPLPSASLPSPWGQSQPGTCSSEPLKRQPLLEMRHAHLVLRAILLPPGPGPFKAHGNILQPFTLSQKRGGIQSQIKAICHASIPKQQGQSTPHHAACPASSDGVQSDSGNRLSLSFHS